MGDPYGIEGYVCMRWAAYSEMGLLILVLMDRVSSCQPLFCMRGSTNDSWVQVCRVEGGGEVFWVMEI